MIDALKRLLNRCQHPGCWKPGHVYHDQKAPFTQHRYCQSHARESGFCRGCERFVQLGDFGMCPECEEHFHPMQEDPPFDYDPRFNEHDFPFRQ
jgi:hypothetical protein